MMRELIEPLKLDLQEKSETERMAVPERARILDRDYMILDGGGLANQEKRQKLLERLPGLASIPHPENKRLLRALA